MTRHRDRVDEQGAVAVMFAIMVTMLFIIAALAVDLGNAWSRKTDTQNQADFGAYNVGVDHALEIATGTVGTHPSDPVLDDIAEYLNDNSPQDDEGVIAVTRDHLKDAELKNGDATYVADGLRITSPEAWVQFGFANVIDVSGRQVQSKATVGVFSAGPRIFPLMALDSACTATDYFHEGYTVVKETTGGGTPPPDNPALAFPTDDNATELSEIQVFDPSNVLVFDSTSATQGGVIVGDHGYTLRLTGAKWNSTKIGFFRQAQGAETVPVLAAVQPLTSPSPYTTTGNGTSIQLATIPDEVADTEAWWYARVFNQNGQWSPINAGPLDKAQRFKVGNPEVLPGCAADASNQGNFGMISLPQQENYNDEDELAWNIAAGLDDPMGLVVHPNGTANGGDCAEFPSVYPADSNEPGTSNGNPQPEAKVNCISTITGLFKGIETGLIQGPDASQAGLLDAGENPTRSGCGSDFSVNMQDGGPVTLNGESIDCYFDSSAGVTLQQVADDNYSGPPAFDEEIFESPRFGLVPVFTGTVSGTGTKKAIVNFQAAFITDNPFYANDDATPGLYLTANGSGEQTLKSVTMFLFSRAALPDPPDGVELIDYLGVGDPIVHLVD